MKVQDYPYSCKDTYGRLVVGAAVGVTADMLERVDALVKVSVDVITIDTAHGHSRGVLDAVRRVKVLPKSCPDWLDARPYRSDTGLIDESSQDLSTDSPRPKSKHF